jgi:hypothetical protein
VILSIDPGVRHFGAALFSQEADLHPLDDFDVNNSLGRAALIRNPIKSDNDPAVAFAACEALHRWLNVDARRVRVVVVEIPRVYPAARQKGDQNDLIALAGVAYALACSVVAAEVRVRYFPRDWKGTIDGDTMIRRIEARLSKGEASRIEPTPKSLRHNVIDAIGIGLKYLERLEPHRVYPGATVVTYEPSPEEVLSRNS